MSHSSQPEHQTDSDWMPYSRPSKMEGTTERSFDAVEFKNKNLHLKFPSVDWSEARLVAEGDPEWGMEYLSPRQLLPTLPCLSASSAGPMTAEELEKHLDRAEAGPAETPDIDPRRNRHLFVDSAGSKRIRAGIVYVQELPPAYLKFADQDAHRFYTKTVRIESRMTVACTEDEARMAIRSDFDPVIASTSGSTLSPAVAPTSACASGFVRGKFYFSAFYVSTRSLG
ncbi:BZ3500_MvSof-1268-A1-R1_Chr9g10465 [Microbotryum saponariae]|uniref:BZ3500_MvSof-1268-A1-R1_Chr9g10465 protein n=1 Tax=Microbotryum saponariae TaxID=289078 RepID=A0A2X0LUL2_9BASI|nr:BZ3501_MvSof-1269-A2-R1_Chr9g10215 [Microbotryum saponariae]SDA00135.1 BZ3500_MvSof-1268-A1-R1_Chr9g10465 [Microbotryum saponariae]